MNLRLRKLAAYVFTWVMVMSPLAVIVPSATAHAALSTGGTYRLDADFSNAFEDDYWLTTPLEWGTLGANLEVRHILGSNVGLDDAERVFDGSGNHRGWDEDDIDDGIDLRLCAPSELDTAATGENSEDIEVEDNADSTSDDYNSVDIYDDTVLTEDPTDEGAFPYPRTAGFTEELRDAFNDDAEVAAGATDPGTIDDNDDGRISRAELTDVIREDNNGADNDAIIHAAVRTMFEDVDVDEVGVWTIVSGADCDTTDGEGVAVAAFRVLPANDLEVTVSPATLTFEFDDDEDEPEVEDLETTITVRWGGDAIENAEITMWACDWARDAFRFCSDDEDPDPITGDAEGVELTGSDGAADFDDDFPGAGTYLIEATCIVIDDDDEVIEDPEDLEDDAEHECGDPDDADYAGEVPQLRGNTTLTIRPGQLEVTKVRGDTLFEDRVAEAVWEIRYPNDGAFVLADNTHGDDDNIYALDNANWTLDITMPNGRHVLLAATLPEIADEVTGEDVEADGILECDPEDNECDEVTWELLSAEDVTDCEDFAGDNYDCPEDDGTLIDDVGDVDVVTLPDDTDDVNSGLDPRVFITGTDGTENAIWGVRTRLNPEVDTEEPDESGFNVIDDEEEDDDDLDRRLGYLSVFVPWAAGTYQFQLRVNQFSDHNPEWVGTWSLSVAGAPEFGFDDVEPSTIKVPTRLANSGILPNDPDWEPDPSEETDEDLFEDELSDSGDAAYEDDPPFAYVLAFRLVDEEGDDVNAYPCMGTENDGETVEADPDDGDDENEDDIIFAPANGEDRDCANFDGVDDIRIEGDFLYPIHEDWIVETELVDGDEADIPDTLETCVDLATRTEFDLGLDDPEDFDPVTGDGPLEGDEAAVPVYCIYNVVPASPRPIRVIATIDGQEFVQEWNVTGGGFLRVTGVTATAEADGQIRVALTDANGNAVNADIQLFERGDFPADDDPSAGAPVLDEDGDAITASGGVLSISEEDEIPAGRYALYAIWGGAGDTLDYAYATVNIEPESDLETSVSPARVTAGVEAEFSVNVTNEDAADDAYEVFFLTHYDYLRIQREGVSYVDSEDYREGEGLSSTDDKFDFDFTGAESDAERLTLKANGPYHVYVRNADNTHDNNGSMPTIEVVPPTVSFSPGRVAFAVDDDVEVTVRVTDMDGNPLDGTLRVAYDPDNDYFTSDSYGFAGIEGGDVSFDTDVDDDEEWGGVDPDDIDAVDSDGYPYSYLEYRDEDDDESTIFDVLTTIDVTNGEARIRVTGEETGPINWTFDSDEGGEFWVNTTGALEIASPAITLTPSSLVAGQPADVTVNVSDLEGAPVEGLLLTLCGQPLATETACTGIVQTDANGRAVVSILPTGTGQLEVWVHEAVAGQEEGDCQMDFEDFDLVNPRTGDPLTAAEGDDLDPDCDEDDLGFQDTDVFLQVVATQSLLRITVPDRVSAGSPVNLVVSVGNAPQAGATVTVTGPTNQQIFSGQTNNAGQATFTPDVAGRYTARASLQGYQDGQASFEVVAGAVDETATFTVTGFEVSAPGQTGESITVRVGDTVSARGTVTNTGATRGTANVVLLVNGAQRANQGVTLDPGESQDIAFDFTPSVAGTATLQMKAGQATSPTKSVTVQPRDTGGDGDGGNQDDEPVTPGFEAILALAALGVAFVAFRRRK